MFTQKTALRADSNEVGALITMESKLLPLQQLKFWKALFISDHTIFCFSCLGAFNFLDTSVKFYSIEGFFCQRRSVTRNFLPLAPNTGLNGTQ